MLQIYTLEVNSFPTNCYIVADETGEGIIIDGGCYFDKDQQELTKLIADHAITIKHHLCTHLHLDHVFGNPFIKRTYQVGAKAHKADLFLLDEIEEHCQRFGLKLREPSEPLEGFLEEGDRVCFGNSTLEVLHVPGHSPGSLCFYEPKQGVLFTGDVLFAGSIGRTDLMQGDYDRLIEGICTKLLTLPAETKVYPGHGAQTTIEKEVATNPFLHHSSLL